MRKIELTKDKYALVDDEDFEYLSRFKWYFGGRRYAVRTINHSQKQYMHRLIMNAPKGMEIDHINGNELDNRKDNLRIVTIRQNQLNAKNHKDSISGYKGVYLRRKDNKWVVYIEKKFMGAFLDKAEAALTYNNSARKLYGEYARLNQL